MEDTCVPKLKNYFISSGASNLEFEIKCASEIKHFFIGEIRERKM